MRSLRLLRLSEGLPFGAALLFHKLFHYTSFRSTTVLRWEYRPGPTVFALWRQGREEYLDGQDAFRFGQDFGHVFSTPACNTFLVKFAYWFNY